MTIQAHTHTYHSENTEINFFINEEDHLHVTIDTDKVHIRSVRNDKKESLNHATLFSDKEVMKKFGTGEIKTKEYIFQRVEVWTKRWHEKNLYNAPLTVCKADSDDFIGHVGLRPGDNPGEADLCYLLKKEEWNKGYTSDLVSAVVKEYAPATVAEGYLLNDQPLQRISSTVRDDNPYSEKILQKVGMIFTHKSKKHEENKPLEEQHERSHYSIELNTIKSHCVRV